MGQYAKRITESLSHICENAEIEIIKPIIFYRKMDELPIKPSETLHYKIIRRFPPILYSQLYKRLGWAPPYDLIYRGKYDIMMFFNYVRYPLRRKTPSIIFIYDLSYVHYPEFTSPKNLLWLNKFVPRSIKRASKIVTISESSRNDISAHYDIPREKISIVYPAVNHEEYKPRTKKEVEHVRKKYDINSPYILSVCTLEPRKNLIGVLKAFDNLPQSIKETYTLVLAGGKGWLDGEIDKLYNKLSESYSIIKTGYVDDNDLPPLFSGAELFVYPAFYEGFGMPPLEAMACGTPVITSKSSSLPEVVGDAAILVDPSNTQALSDSMVKVLGDKLLQRSMIKNGLKQSKNFNWDESALELLKIINETVYDAKK